MSPNLKRAALGLLMGALLLPCALAWLDAARAVTGERYAYRKAPRRVVVLGFDGVDPKLVREYLPHLPTIARLAREGTFLPCRSTNPPESPVAWATFETGGNPGRHGIFDFVERDASAPDSYEPVNGMVSKQRPVFGPFDIPIRPLLLKNRRGGEGFWMPVARAGYKISVLRMPDTFPPTPPRGGELLCGLGVPDLRGTNGSYTLFQAGRDAQDDHTIFGGVHVKIYPRNGAADASLEGPPDPRAPASSGKRLVLPVHFTFSGRTATVSVDGGEPVPLQVGLYSHWVKVDFPMGAVVKLHGILRFLLIHAGPDPSIYASPIQLSPYNPPFPISEPHSFVSDLVARLHHPFKTAGWPEDTFASNDGVLDDVHLYEDIEDTYRSDERIFFDRLDHSGASLVSMVFTATDRMSHMFFRYRDERHPAHDPKVIARFRERTGVSDPILSSYEWMDATLKATLERLGENDVLLVVSDHGFHTWRTGVNLNTWLWQHGYLVLSDPEAGNQRRSLREFYQRSSLTGHIDWKRTRAFALGLGQIYINLKGRECDGIVDPAGKVALEAEISRGLLALHGPDGTPVFTHIYRGDKIWHGPYTKDGPDLQCAFADTYRVSWQTALLGVPLHVFEANKLPWSGDHCSNDVVETPGIFFSNKKLAPGTKPALRDIAPTVCSLFDVPLSKDYDGKPLPLILASTQ